MDTAFIIMAFGHTDLDKVADDVIAPALMACGLDPKRVDRDNSGGLIKAEIMSFINDARIIIGDLTLARPNCYLEVGYTMGVDKFSNLILTVREDHFHDSPNYKSDGHRLHFDLTGYDVLRWDPKDMGAFRTALEAKIKKRQSNIASTKLRPPAVAEDWFAKHRAGADALMAKVERKAYREFTFSLGNTDKFSPAALLRAAQDAEIHTFGWCVVPFIDTDDLRPKPLSDGIVAEMLRPERRAFDYWAIRKTGNLFARGSLFEDDPGGPRTLGTEIYFDTRIVRTTEILMYCQRFYTALGLDKQRVVQISIKHTGLKGRFIGSADPRHNIIRRRGPAHENELTVTLNLRLEQLGEELPGWVKEFLDPMFVLFGFFEPPQETYNNLVQRYQSGRL